MPAPAKPEQTERRRKITRRFERQYGLTSAEIHKAQSLHDQLAADPAMTQIGWDEILGSNEWKMRRFFSITTQKLSAVEFVIGKAVTA